MRGELGRASEPGRWQTDPRRWGRGAWPGWASSSVTRVGRGARAVAGLTRGCGAEGRSWAGGPGAVGGSGREPGWSERRTVWDWQVWPAWQSGGEARRAGCCCARALSCRAQASGGVCGRGRPRRGPVARGWSGPGEEARKQTGLGREFGLLGWSLGRVGLVFWFDFLFWAGLSLDMGFLFFFSPSISISKSNQTI